MRKRRTALHRVFILAGGTLVLHGCATFPQSASPSNDLPAFSQVDDGLYRGGQPSPEGLEQVNRMGIKTVISLRQPSRAMQEERRLVEALGMEWVNMPMWFWWRPSDEQVHRFLRIVTDPTKRPVFAHCRQGWNRVGVMVAIYRVVRQRWTPQQAYAEARRFGLVPWNLLTRYVLFHETQREYLLAPSPA